MSLDAAGNPNPLVSIVVSCFLNGPDAAFRARTLDATLASLRAQTYRPLEVLVVHSGPYGDPADPRRSPIGLEALRGAALTDWWFTPDNRDRYGHCWRQEGARRTRGGVIGLANDDGLYANVYVERLVAHITAGADLVLSSWVNGFTDPAQKDYPGYQPERAAPAVGRADVGSWLATRELVLGTPWTDHRPLSDGWFVEAMAKRARKVAVEDRLLYMHQ